jgi:hypothetical protein
MPSYQSSRTDNIWQSADLGVRHLRYRDHDIVATTTIHAPTGKPLHEVIGEYGKPAATRPFLLTPRNAIAWLDAMFDAGETANE